jgi:hypothetical protein
MMELSEYQEAGRRLIEKLRLYTDSVAIKYIRDIFPRYLSGPVGLRQGAKSGPSVCMTRFKNIKTYRCEGLDD